MMLSVLGTAIERGSEPGFGQWASALWMCLFYGCFKERKGLDGYDHVSLMFRSLLVSGAPGRGMQKDISLSGGWSDMAYAGRNSIYAIIS